MRKPARKQGRYTQRTYELPMLDDYGFETFEENQFPIAYLLTFRTYGTWLHGDERGSNQRRRTEPFQTVHRDQNLPLAEEMSHQMKQPAMIFDLEQRELVEEAIKETCRFREYVLRALNVRTNHVHAVVSKYTRPEKIVNDLKAYSTRNLRQAGAIANDRKVWSRGASTRYLWKPRHVDAAIDYVLNCQGDAPFDPDGAWGK